MVSLSLIVSFVLAFVPLPDGSGKPKSHHEAFPCQDHACGCRTATQCWTSCCCMSHRQKVVWAEANRVLAPDFVIEAAQREQCEKPVTVSKCSHAGCSKHHRHAESPVKENDSTVAFADRDHSAESSENAWVAGVEPQGEPSVQSMGLTQSQTLPQEFSDGVSEDDSDHNPADCVIGLFAQQCRGLSWTLGLLGFSLPQSSDEPVVLSVIPLDRIPPTELIRSSVSYPPDEPPPRWTCAC